MEIVYQIQPVPLLRREPRRPAHRREQRRLHEQKIGLQHVAGGSAVQLADVDAAETVLRDCRQGLADQRCVLVVARER
jgi:hypothetical protein